MSEAEGQTNPKTAYEQKDAAPALILGLMALVAAVAMKRAAAAGFPDWLGNPQATAKQAAKSGAPGKAQ
ncbi:MAG: hypothetical protein ACREE4_06955 [Stellaceae bacterium]